jgi:hypothetical protein
MLDSNTVLILAVFLGFCIGWIAKTELINIKNNFSTKQNKKQANHYRD